MKLVSATATVIKVLNTSLGFERACGSVKPSDWRMFHTYGFKVVLGIRDGTRPNSFDIKNDGNIARTR
jgi:hypothetical protein